MKKEDIQENSNSKIRIWAEKQKEKNRNTDIRSYNILFDALIYILASFNKLFTISQAADQKQVKRGQQKYTGDTPLFELGCYLFFQIDVWCFQNHYRKWRKNILPLLTRRFLLLFENALHTKHLESVFENRLHLYARAIQGKLVPQSLTGQTNNDQDELPKTINFYLTQLILKTANNTLPKIYKFNEKEDYFLVPLSTNIIDIFLVGSAVLNWETHMFPVCLETISSFMSLDKENTD